MSLKNKIAKSWKHPELDAECSKKDQMEFSQRKRRFISIPVYVTSLASVILVCCLVVFVSLKTNDKQKVSNGPTVENVSYHSDFGLMSYTAPQLNAQYVMKVTETEQAINKNTFVQWFNNLNLHNASVDYSQIDYVRYIGNSQCIKVLYNNDTYYIYFTMNYSVLINCNQMYVIYDLENAPAKISSFLNNTTI